MIFFSRFFFSSKKKRSRIDQRRYLNSVYTNAYSDKEHKKSDYFLFQCKEGSQEKEGRVKEDKGGTGAQASRPHGF